MHAPLASWRFDGVLRRYQADVLERVSVDAGGPLHIVAPPGSGKTLLGLLLAVRRGRRAVVLTPNLTIRAQWAEAARGLVPGTDAAGDPVSEDPAMPGELTALSYQALSVVDTARPLDGLAARAWREELVADGRAEDAAQAWLTELAASNPRAYRAGILRRARTLRRALIREDPEVLSAALHPNARALIDRLVAHGVETVILDECHHLLDHWALVVATLLARLRAAGREPLVIGLTATLPSPDDADEYDNYTALLGDVDYEVPTPAVVREGNLAPYRALVHVVEPTREERAFLRSQAEGLEVVIRTTFARDDGLDYLAAALQPPRPEPVPAATDALTPPPPPRVQADDTDVRLGMAFAADFAGAEATAAMLTTVAPTHPLVPRLPAPAHRPPTSEEALRLLGRYALDRVLPDPARRAQWERIRRTLADFGYALSDRGLRRTRDPIDTMLASSLAKDHGVCDILRREREALGDARLRALVVTDFAVHGNRHGGLVSAAGALRTFDVMANDAGVAGLRALLITGTTTRIRAEDAAALLPALARELGAEPAIQPVPGSAAVVEVTAPGVRPSDMVRAAAALLTAGTLHVVVGTRGLFGEGWDCPAVNTLIDLTAVATASATQQLRGRSLRLDPAWPAKVAHNWTVTALLPPGFAQSAAPDAARLRRKHAHLWGLDRDDPARIVRGLPAALDAAERAAFRAVANGTDSAALDALRELLHRPLPPREDSYAQWQVGAPYTDDESVSALVHRPRAVPLFRSSRPVSRAMGAVTTGYGALALAAASVPVVAPSTATLILGGLAAVAAGYRALRAGRRWWQGRRQWARPAETYRRAASVTWAALHGAGRVGGAAHPDLVVHESPTPAGMIEYAVEAPAKRLADQRVLAEALIELFGPVRTPRFLLETGARRRRKRRLPASDDRAHFLPVPSLVGRRRADAEAFAAAWQREIGPAILHELKSPEAMALAARARRTGSGEAPQTRERWR